MRNVIGWVNLTGGTAKPINLTGMNSTIKAAYAALILSSAANGGNLDGVTYLYPAIVSPSDIISLSETGPDWLSTYNLSALYSHGTAPVLAGNPYTVSPYPIGIPYGSSSGGGGGSGSNLTAEFYNVDKQLEGDFGIAFEDGEGSIDVILNDVDRDPSLTSAILISLLSDKRAQEFDSLPSDDSDRRGWWGDATQSDEIGSKLWLLERSKLTEDYIPRFEYYVKDCLNWMIADGVAAEIEVTTSIKSGDTIELTVLIYRPRDSMVKFTYNWKTMLTGKGY
jgi:phage gp46-like protein